MRLMPNLLYVKAPVLVGLLHRSRIPPAQCSPISQRMSAMGFTCRGWIDHLAKTLSEEYRPVRCTRCTGQVNSVKHREEGSCTRRTATCLEDSRPRNALLGHLYWRGTITALAWIMTQLKRSRLLGVDQQSMWSWEAACLFWRSLEMPRMRGAYLVLGRYLDRRQ